MIDTNPDSGWFEIHPVFPNQVIDNLVVQGPPFLAMIRIIEECDDPTTKVQDVWNIVGSSTHTHQLGLVQIDGDLGSVNIHSIGDLFIGGDITGNIISTQSANPIVGITTVDAAGSIYGDIRAPFGRIAFIRADGDIGTAAAPVVIEAQTFISHITQAQNLYADINTRVNGGTGTISRIVVDTFVGSLETRAMTVLPSGSGLLRFNLQLNATITFGESYTGDPATHAIEVPVGGLTTQIIINADNVGAAWDAPVKIGFDGDPDQIILTGPGYTNTAESLGGGSVGLAPFDLHDESCAPPNGETVLLKVADPALEVGLRHYGPITLGVDPPVTLERRVACTGNRFDSLPSEDFVYLVDPDDANSLLVSGAPGAPGFEIGYEYRLIAAPDLLCDEVTGNPPVSWDSPDYRVTVRPGCLADLDEDDDVGVPDLLILLGNWGPCPGCSADLDCDGNVGVADLLLLLGAWGPCGSLSVGVPRSVDDCIDKFFYQIYDPVALENCLEAVAQ